MGSVKGKWYYAGRTRHEQTFSDTKFDQQIPKASQKIQPGLKSDLHIKQISFEDAPSEASSSFRNQVAHGFLQGLELNTVT